jgi:Tol biopolymer transport system component
VGALATAVIGVAALVVLGRPPGRPAATQGAGGAAALAATQIKLTDTPGAEITPSLSPDGKFVAYASRASGNMDVYVLRIGGSKQVNLTADSAVDDSEPAFSPDGSRIAFRSERDGGGLFVMGATGESVVRITDRGYRPAWSPDGTRLVFASADFTLPTARPARSELWVIEVASGKARKIFDGDAVQPSWSPSGQRIAYWAIPGTSGQRDIWTIPAEGGTPVAVTEDAPLDWNPVWAADGRHLYFSSTRGGSMNLWRVAIDEATGRTQAPPEPVTFGAGSEIHSASVSRGGRSIVTVGSVLFQSVRRATIEPERGRVTLDPAILQRSSNPMIWLDCSPDGKQIVYSTTLPGERPGQVREEIVVSAVDGTSRRSIAVSDSRNRLPRWSPKGDRVSFASDRDGDYRIYTVHPDGSDLHLLEGSDADSVYTAWGPAGDRLVTMRAMASKPARIVPWPLAGKPIEEIPSPPEGVESFVPSDWSRDGTFIAGHNQGKGGDEPGGILIYEVAARRYVPLTDRGSYPRWLPDSRRLMYTRADRRSIFLVDRITLEVREMPFDLRGSFDTFSMSLARDGRTIYLVESDLEADLWLLDVGGAGDGGAGDGGPRRP